MRIDHIGYAVKKMDLALTSFEKLGFQFEPVVDDKDRNIRISFGEKDGYRVELVSPLDKEKESPIDVYLSKIGPTPYHICYQVEDISNTIENLKKQGFRIVIGSAAAVAFAGRNVAFMTNLGTGLLELVEES